jgi:4-hydroxy-2-oxoheptanedioate aldolase
MKRPNLLRDRLSVRGALIGLLQSQPNPSLTEMAAMCGYDFVMLDGEHGVLSETDHLQALQLLGASQVVAFVRVANHDIQAIGRYMDMGAHAIVVPNVTTAEEASALVQAMNYPPVGARGFGAPLHRASKYGADLAEHVDSPREGVLLFAMIESALGVRNAAAIASIQGIDGLFIGPSDLSAGMGGVGDFSRPAYAEAVECIEKAAHAHGKILGTAPHPGYPIESLAARGYRFLIIGADMAMIYGAMNSQVAAAKAALVATQPKDKR